MSSSEGRDWTRPYFYTGGAAYTARRDITALGVLATLRQPELAGDLKAVSARARELLDEIENPAT